MVSIMYKVSIIIPVYNAGDYLYSALDSIKKQTLGFKDIEVIFVDDRSNDNSKSIISDFSKKYSNVKGVFLEENSGLPGKPRNIGIKNASSDYLMFLDQDDVFLEDACEILYNEITNNNVDLVSGNYFDAYDDEDVLVNWKNYGLTEDRIFVKSIKENLNLFNVYPSQWAKIFKKEFILKNNIIFAEGRLAEDLLFVYHALVKANGILFINKPIMKYNRKLNEQEDRSITYSNFDKKFLSGYIKTYTETYNILNKENKEYGPFVLNHMHYWSKNFILSNISRTDKLELLNYASYLYNEFEKSNLRVHSDFKYFFEAIFKNDYVGAIEIAESLRPLFIKKDNKQIISEDLKDRTIFLLFYGLDVNIGGLAKAVFNRANALSKKGYNVKILNIDYSAYHSKILGSPEGFKNFKYIEKQVRELNYLDKDIEMINAFDYYSSNENIQSSDNDLNNDKFDKTYTDSNFSNKLDDNEFGEKYANNIFINKDFIIEKTNNKDESITLKYYDKTILENTEDIDLSKHTDKIIKREKYSDGILYVKSIYKNGFVSADYLYTSEGYNYMVIEKINESNLNIFLKNPEYDFSIKFNNLKEFLNYFVSSFCLSCDKKPFLIDETSGPATSMGPINENIAFRLAMFHNNFYQDPYCYGSPLSDFSSFKVLDDLDGIILLTETQKKDFNREFEFKNTYVIPNFITDFELKNKCSPDKSKVNKNKVSIFTRISPEKRLSDSIKAFKIVTDSKPDAILEIYGRAIKEHEIDELNKLKQLTDDLKLNDNVFFKGHVNNVTEEMRNSLCAIATSDIEGLSMVLIEAMANGTPFVTYDINYGPSDVITNGVDGIIVERYDIENLAKEIIKLLDNPEKALKMGESAREKISDKFSQDVVISKWEQLFDDILIKDGVKKIQTSKYSNLSQIKPGNLNNVKYNINSNIKLNDFRDLEFKIKLLKEDFEKTNLIIKETIDEILKSKSLKLISIMNKDFKKIELITNYNEKLNYLIKFYENEINQLKNELFNSRKKISELNKSGTVIEYPNEFKSKLSTLELKLKNYESEIKELNLFIKNFEQKTLYSNFDNFLANTYLLPIIEAPFNKEHEKCFKVMKDIEKYLSSNISKMVEKPLVSVIMPVYNRANIIERAINSVLNQNYENLELIIIDDGSTDNTINIINNIKDDRINLILHEKNQGAAAARNTGLKNANGTYVAYLDSDNEWDLKYLEATIGGFVELPDADAVYSGQLIYDRFDSPIKSIRFGSYNKSLLHNNNYIDMNCFVHKIDIYKEIGGFDTDLKRLVDWDFILRISNSFNIYSLPILLSKYYEHNADNRISDVIELDEYRTKLLENNKIIPKKICNLSKKVNILIHYENSLNSLKKCVQSIVDVCDFNYVNIYIIDSMNSNEIKKYVNSLKKDNFKIIDDYSLNKIDFEGDILLLSENAILTEGSVELMQKSAYELHDCGIIVTKQILPNGNEDIRKHVPYANPSRGGDITASYEYKNLINMPLFNNDKILELNYAPLFCNYIKRDIFNQFNEQFNSIEDYSLFLNYIHNILKLKIYYDTKINVYNID